MKHKILESYLAIWIRDYFAVPVEKSAVTLSAISGSIVILDPTVTILHNPLSLIILPLENLIAVTTTGVTSFPLTNMFLGERKQVGIRVSRLDENDISFDSVSYAIYSRNGTLIGSPETVQINEGDIFVEVDASTIGHFYVEFTITVKTTVCKARRYYEVLK